MKNTQSKYARKYARRHAAPKKTVKVFMNEKRQVVGPLWGLEPFTLANGEVAYRKNPARKVRVEILRVVPLAFEL